MTQVLLLSNNEKKINFLKDCLKQQSFSNETARNEEEVFEYLQKNSIDIILIDTTSLEDVVNLCRKIKVSTQAKNITVALIVDTKQNSTEFLKYGNVYITEPVDKDILLSTITSSLQTKESWDELTVNNSELAKSLYRLNVLNKTVTSLAGYSHFTTPPLLLGFVVMELFSWPDLLYNYFTQKKV